MAIPTAVVRRGAGVLATVVALWVSYFAINVTYRALGGKGSFVRWSIGVLDDVIRPKG